MAKQKTQSDNKKTATVKTDKDLKVIPMIHKGLKEPQIMPVQQAHKLLCNKHNGGWEISKDANITWTIDDGFKLNTNTGSTQTSD
jgi:hypothetical protein